MRVILVDDEPLSLDLFKIECGNMPGFEVVGFFDAPEKALLFAQSNPVDFALLDIDMPGMSGITLARRLREIWPKIVIIFVTAHPEFSADALQIKADYVVFKPYEREDILDALERARLLGERKQKRITVRTFGHFDVFADGKLVNFKSSKAKELLALCISRMGGEVTIYEMQQVLWSDSGNQGVGYRTTIKALSDTLKEVGADGMLLRKRSALALNTNEFSCDLFDFKNGREDAINAYHGEFMLQYPWAEAMSEELRAEKRRRRNSENNSHWVDIDPLE